VLQLRGRGPAVIMMHGLAGSKALWSEFAETLAGHGFRAIAFDHRGHGRSTDAGRPWTIADLADEPASLMDSLGIERAALIGHSMGGRTLIEFAVSHPERVWAVVPVGAHSEAPGSPERIAEDAAFAARFEAEFARKRAPCSSRRSTRSWRCPC
jgi:pimeloyl-ACP methyl ester carboxylesterase